MMQKSIFKWIFVVVSHSLLAEPAPSDPPPRRPYCWENRTVYTTGSALIGVGGGVWAGYVAGHNRQRFSGNASLDDPLCEFSASSEEVSLEWILPIYDDPMGSVTVLGQIYRPDQTLFSSATLTPSGATPSTLPSIEGQVGEYTILLTLQVEVSSMPDGLFLGGISFNSSPVMGDLIFSNQPGNMVPAGTQVSLVIRYPEGPFGTQEES